MIEKIHSRQRSRDGTVPPPGGRSPRSRRKATATSAALLASSTALVLAACGGPAASSASSSSSSGGVVDITWQTMWSGNTLTLLSQMVNEFNSTHPDIHVTESNIPSATGDAKLLSEIAAGDPPSVFTEWNPVLGENRPGAAAPWSPASSSAAHETHGAIRFPQSRIQAVALRLVPGVRRMTSPPAPRVPHAG